LNQNLKIGLVLLLLAGVVYGLTGLYFSEFGLLLLLVGIAFVGYGAWRPLSERKRDGNERLLWNAGELLVALGLILLALGIPGLLIVPPCAAYPYQCSSNYAISLDVVFAGIASIIVGVGLMIASLLLY
jgi:hypothetical protein